MTTESLSHWDWKSTAVWLLAHIGAVMTGMMLVLAWWRRRGRLHLRGLRVRVRFHAVDCLCWSLSPRFGLSQLYWLARRAREWEVAATLRAGLMEAGLPVRDPAFAARLLDEIRTARATGLFERFRETPAGTEVRTPAEDRAEELQRLRELAAEATQRGWGTLADALTRVARESADPVFFQAVCDLWLRNTQNVLLDVVFRQCDRQIELLKEVQQEVQPLTKLEEVQRDLKAILRHVESAPREEALPVSTAVSERLVSAIPDVTDRSVGWSRLAVVVALLNTLATLGIGWLVWSVRRG